MPETHTSLREARGRSGLRLIVIRDIPSPRTIELPVES